MRERISEALTQAFHPEILEVIDESHEHLGHAGNTMQGESHFKVVISRSAFGNESTLTIHKKIYGALGEIMQRIHALSINLT